MRTKEPMLRYKPKQVLSMVDICTLAIVAVYSAFCLIWFPKVNHAVTNIAVNAIVATVVLSLAELDKMRAGRLITLLRMFYPMVVVPFMYAQINTYITVINPGDIDHILIALDQALFLGHHPTHLLQAVAHPLLTEYLQITYMLFFPLPVILGAEQFAKGNYDNVKKVSYTIAAGFYVSYILYLFSPAIGPRFTLHDFSSLSAELPGVFLTESARYLVNAGASVLPETPNPAEVVNKDCMPSGHTMMTLMTMIMAFSMRSGLRWYYLVLGSSLIFATVYLRYHYVVDVLAGMLWAVAVLAAIEPLRKSLHKRGWVAV